MIWQESCVQLSINGQPPKLILMRYSRMRVSDARDEHIAIKALEMALHYRFGKPMTIVAGPEEQPPIKIDISAIPQHRIPVEK